MSKRVNEIAKELELTAWSSRRRKRAWEKANSSNNVSLPPNFETEEVCFERQLTLVDRLMKDPVTFLPVIKEVLACMCLPHPCRRPYCSACGRQFRVWLCGELSGLVKKGRASSHVVTIILRRIPVMALRFENLTAIKASLRTNCIRLGLKDLPVCGGIEVAYDCRENNFILHAHLLVIGGTTNEWAKLRPLFSKKCGPRSVKVQPVRDISRQVSYLLKFNTYHRPGSQYGSHRAKAVPLPIGPLQQLEQWWSKFELHEFLFLHRFRIVGGHIKPSAPLSLRPT